MTTDLIYGYVTDPAHNIFKNLRNSRAMAFFFYCSEPTCPLRAAGQCLLQVSFGTNCPYGLLKAYEGPTRKAQKYGAWRQAQQAALGACKAPIAAPERLAFIGEWVYLPYAHR